MQSNIIRSTGYVHEPNDFRLKFKIALISLTHVMLVRMVTDYSTTMHHRGINTGGAARIRGAHAGRPHRLPGARRLVLQQAASYRDLG